MADTNQSKFLRYQDKNNDGLIDECGDVPQPPEGKCPPCTPDPNFVNPNWRQLDSTEPWFNGKFCKYQVAVQTSYSSLISPPIAAIYEEYSEEAIESLLLGFNKSDTTEARESLRAELDYQKYYLEPHPNSYVKLLYSVPYETLAQLPDIDDDEIDEEADSDSGPDITTTFKADYIHSKNLRFRKAMNLYKRFYRVYSWAEGGQLIFVESGKMFSVAQFDRYGDAGTFAFSRCTMANVLTDLDRFLNDRGMNIYGVGRISFFQDRVTKIELTWTSKYKLKKMRVWTVGCGGKPKHFGEKRLRALNSKAAWKDPTAMAYFAQLNKIDEKLNARQEIPWIDIVKEFTYPEIAESPNVVGDNISRSEMTVGSCIADSLGNEMKALGQDIVDDIFSIGDAVAYMFHKNICMSNTDEAMENLVKMGLAYDPVAREDKPMMSMAMEQAFKELEDGDAVFVSLCARILYGASGGGMGSVSVQKLLDGLWAEGFDRIKLCGLFDLLMDAITCLMGGLSLEDALARLIKSALKAMSIDNLGDFFIGLPPEKQAELEALVKKKIESGDVFKEASGSAVAGGQAQVLSDTISGKLKWSVPWKKKSGPNGTSTENDQPDASTGVDTVGKQSQKTDSQNTRRTLAQTLDPAEMAAAAENELSPNIVLEAYILALIDVYKDDLLSVVDLLNKYPGAQIIAKILALADCPRPPMFDPNFLDFLKSIDLPWCTGTGDLKLPKMVNPFGWIPKLKDFAWIAFWILMLLIQRLIVQIIMKILVKICELIGSAICKALETVGALAAAVVTDQTFRGAIRDTICGEDASDSQVDDTIADMFAKFGIGGAALADKDRLLNFAEDMASSVTRGELTDAFLGNMSADMGQILMNLIEFEYPEYQEAFPSADFMGDFFTNVGNLIPQDIQQGMREFLDALPEEDNMPANPSLCASPQQLEDFQELRCSILEGRATPEQCRVMFDNLQNEMLDDLEDLANFANNPFPDDLPLVSSPGCDDGMIPFESEEAAESIGNVMLGGDMKALKRAYSEDMLGSGPWESDYGLINMIMSDTMGRPITLHHRKSAFSPRYVDFVTDGEVPDEKKFFLFFADPAPTTRQIGNYPYAVAPWLHNYLGKVKSDIEFESNNSFKTYSTHRVKYKDLDFVGFFGDLDIDLLKMPDFGYNVKLTTRGSTKNGSVGVKRRGRKGTADVQMEFKDNNAGRDAADWLYGFKIRTYFADMQTYPSPVSNNSDRTVNHNVGSFVAPLDATRIDITEMMNPRAGYDDRLRNTLTTEEWKDYKKLMKEKAGSSTPMQDRLFEFLAVDDTLTGIDPVTYPEFCTCFEEQQPYSPPVVLLYEMIANQTRGGASVPSKIACKRTIDSFMTNLYKEITEEVRENRNAFKYGATYDSLTQRDTDYVVTAGQTKSPAGTDYGDAEIDDGEGGTRGIRNRDMILGVSRDYLQNGPEKARVFYLNPITYGGSYTNPPVYIKPPLVEGWMAFVDVLFPDMAPCKPRNSDLVDFGSIEKEINRVYQTIPEDQRLKADPDCVMEVPYNRILERPGKAGIQGLIQAACRIYGSTHMIKALATYTVFRPDFDSVYSSISPQYVVEVMEKSLRDAQGDFWEWFNPMKDDEFWYAFLEQSVQTYGRLVDDGTIVDPPQSVLDALFRINDAQDNYDYPGSSSDVKEAKDVGETTAPHRWPFKTKGLKQYRGEKNLEAVRATEEDAKIVLKEWMKQEMNYMGKQFMKNLDSIGLSPKYNNMDYYMISKHAQGTINLELDKEIKPEYVGLPESGEQHYTSGNELSLPDGEMYRGYYHIQKDEDNNILYITGEFDGGEDADHQELTPLANHIKVPIGDIAPLGQVVIDHADSMRPLIVEKYINVGGSRMAPRDAIAYLSGMGHSTSTNVSDVYPGDLEQVKNEAGQVIGVKGSLGIKHGLRFSILMNNRKYTLTSVELSALDTKLAQVDPLDGDSMLLYCLINNLRDTPEFRWISDYIFPIRKVLSTLAIYNDMGFLASIGQKTTPDGDARRTGDSSIGQPSFKSKPGAKATFPNSKEGDFTPNYSESNDKWASAGDRSTWSPFNLTWDEWDQVLLRNSKTRIKKLFKNHYNSRKFNPEELMDEDFFAIAMGNLKAGIKPASGKRVLPWFKKKRLRSNPFNSNGQLCKKKD